MRVVRSLRAVAPKITTSISRPPVQYRSAALLTVAGEDVSVSGRDASAASAAQPHRLQLGGVRPAAGAGALEGLFEHRAEGDEGVGAGRVAAVALAARQQHHLEHSRKHTVNQVETSHPHRFFKTLRVCAEFCIHRWEITK